MKFSAKRNIVTIVTCAILMSFMGCGKNDIPVIDKPHQEAVPDEAVPDESAEDGFIDFQALQKENPDVFAWLYIPGTDIDAPVLQSGLSDDYYKRHTADGKEGKHGAFYTEMANLRDMCDFNTVIHGEDTIKDKLFYDLHLLEEPEFFEEHSEIYVYLPDNVLTYTIIASYYDEGNNILRRYDYTSYSGCRQYLDAFYGLREMNMNRRPGFEDLSPEHFLLTLSGSTDTQKDIQYVVIAVLTNDAAGNIDRIIIEE